MSGTVDIRVVAVVMSMLIIWLAFNTVVGLLAVYVNRRAVLAERRWLQAEIARMLEIAEAYANGVHRSASPKSSP